MDQRDQDPLDKQTRRFLPPPRRDGIMILATLTVFFGGMAFGGFLFGLKGPSHAANVPAVVMANVMANGTPSSFTR